MKKIALLSMLLSLFCFFGCEEKEDTSDRDRMALLEDEEESDWQIAQPVDSKELVDEFSPIPQEIIIHEEPEKEGFISEKGAAR